MLLEGVCSRPPPKDGNSGPVSGVEIMRKLSKSHTHNESALRIKVTCICREALACILNKKVFRPTLKKSSLCVPLTLCNLNLV